MIQAAGQDISCGIRVNPEYSEVETELYNPCAPGTRFGVMAEQLPDVLPQGIDGFTATAIASRPRTSWNVRWSIWRRSSPAGFRK